MAEKIEVALDSIEDFKAAIAAQARIAVYQATATALLQARSEFDDVEDLCDAVIEAILRNAEQDMALITNLRGKKP